MAEKILTKQADRSLVSEGKSGLGKDKGRVALPLNSHPNTMVGGKWTEAQPQYGG